jgi:hypothetical protein
VGVVTSDQRLPWNNFAHLLKELALTGFLHAQAQGQGLLVSWVNEAGRGLRQARIGETFAEFSQHEGSC